MAFFGQRKELTVVVRRQTGRNGVLYYSEVSSSAALNRRESGGDAEVARVKVWRGGRITRESPPINRSR